MFGNEQAREKISRETFEQKLRHPLAAKLRKQVEEWMSAFREQDLRAMVAEPQVSTVPLLRSIELSRGVLCSQFAHGGANLIVRGWSTRAEHLSWAMSLPQPALRGWVGGVGFVFRPGLGGRQSHSCVVFACFSSLMLVVLLLVSRCHLPAMLSFCFWLAGPSHAILSRCIVL